MKQKKLSSGFTLLELLVVVAIIGILTAVVMISTSTSRKKGQDSSIKSQMVSLRSQAELYFSINSNYNNLFTSNNTWASTDNNINAILVGVDKQTTTHTAGSSSSAWAAQAQLKLDPTQYFCVDSTFTNKTGTVALAAGGTVCP